ncbi:HIRAN domain-containing protein [Thiofilum flexile]|uniref:HIRAN domain-containing protein n=1 Tax=Thiofilum flexile TaxID=125627 RepID=UPI00037461A5|nr:HIRAN domain-containing protein [Thiofilum flexile]
MSKPLLLFWQNPVSRRWLPVGRLTYANSRYEFYYTQEAQHAHNRGEFLPFGALREFGKTYVSEQLFPTFKNRLLTKSRPEYKEYLGWLGLDPNTTNDMMELELSGGGRATDDLQLFPCPENQDGYYRVRFFAHGLRHIPQHYDGRLKSLKASDRLYLMRDVQNLHNPDALAIRTDNPLEVVGYCPNFLVEDFNKLLKSAGVDQVQLSVARVNVDAPLQFMLQCELRCVWVDGFKPFDTDHYQPVATVQNAA